MTPDERLREIQIRERAEKATPAPWLYVDLGKRDTHYGETITQRERRRGKNRFGETILRHEAQWRMKPANRRFIAHARGDVDWLLEQLEAERALSKRLRETLAACHDALGEVYHGTPLSGDWLVEETGNGAWRDLPDEIRDTLAAYNTVHGGQG